MRYFIDTEFNDDRGELISLALVAEDGRELYVVLPATPNRLLTPWVAQNVMPVIEGTLEHPATPARPLRRNSASILVGTFLSTDAEPMVLADHPVDLAHLCQILDLGEGRVFPIDALQMVYFNVEGFKSSRDSAVPHNALYDARALALHILTGEQAAELSFGEVTEPAFAPLVDMGPEA